MINDQIRQLAMRPDSKGPFVTLYIDTARNDEAQRVRTDIAGSESRVLGH